MSENDRTIENPDGQERAEPRPNVILRSLPAVTFGLRVAALAGMAITTGELTIGLAGIADGGPTNEITVTTCCS